MSTADRDLIVTLRDALRAIVERDFTVFRGGMVDADRKITRDEVLTARAALTAADLHLAQVDRDVGPVAEARK